MLFLLKCFAANFCFSLLSVELAFTCYTMRSLVFQESKQQRHATAHVLRHREKLFTILNINKRRESDTHTHTHTEKFLTPSCFAFIP